MMTTLKINADINEFCSFSNKVFTKSMLQPRIKIEPSKSSSKSYPFDDFWLLLNYNECSDIHQVKVKILNSLIKMKEGLQCHSHIKLDTQWKSLTAEGCHLILCDAIVPFFENSCILRDGDTVQLLILHTGDKPDMKTPQKPTESDHEEKMKTKEERSETRKRELTTNSSESDDMSEIGNHPKKKKRNKSTTANTESCKEIDVNDKEVLQKPEKNIDCKHPKKNEQEEDHDKESDSKNNNYSLITPDIKELLKEKMAEFSSQSSVNVQKTISTDIQNEPNEGLMELDNPIKRKRNRRKKNKSKKSTEIIIKEKPKNPPNYSLNLPSHNNRVVFDESDEDLITEEPFSEPVKETQYQFSLTQAHSNTSLKPMKQLYSPLQNSHTIKTPTKEIGKSIDPSAKFSELTQRTRPRHHHVTGRLTDNSLKSNMMLPKQVNAVISNKLDNLFSPNKLPPKPVPVEVSVATRLQDIANENKETAPSKSEADDAMVHCNGNSSVKMFTIQDINKASLLCGKPCTGQVVAFKMMELSEDYTPSISNFKIGKVTAYEPSSDAVSIHLQEAVKKRSGRFELNYEDDGNEENEQTIDTSFGMLLEVRLLA